MLVGTLLLLLRPVVQGRERILQPDGGDFNRKAQNPPFPPFFSRATAVFRIRLFLCRGDGERWKWAKGGKIGG